MFLCRSVSDYQVLQGVLQNTCDIRHITLYICKRAGMVFMKTIPSIAKRGIIVLLCLHVVMKKVRVL